MLMLFYHLLYSIAKLSFKGKQRNDPTEAERLGNVSTGTKVGRKNENVCLKGPSSCCNFYSATRLSVATQQTFLTSWLTLYHATNTKTLFTNGINIFVAMSFNGGGVIGQRNSVRSKLS